MRGTLFLLVFLCMLMVLTGSVSAEITVPEMNCCVVLADEGNGSVHYVNMADSQDYWSKKCANRDLQLIGNGRLMVSDNDGSGFSELELETGTRIRHVEVAGGASYGGSGYQLLEFDSSLTKVVSYWKQWSTVVASLHGVLVIDGLDTELLHSDVEGVLKPLAAQVSVQPFRRRPARRPIHRAAAAMTIDLSGRTVGNVVPFRCFIATDGFQSPERGITH